MKSMNVDHYFDFFLWNSLKLRLWTYCFESNEIWQPLHWKFIGSHEKHAVDEIHDCGSIFWWLLMKFTKVNILDIFFWKPWNITTPSIENSMDHMKSMLLMKSMIVDQDFDDCSSNSLKWRETYKNINWFVIFKTVIYCVIFKPVMYVVIFKTVSNLSSSKQIVICYVQNINVFVSGAQVAFGRRGTTYRCFCKM